MVWSLYYTVIVSFRGIETKAGYDEKFTLTGPGSNMILP